MALTASHVHQELSLGQSSSQTDAPDASLPQQVFCPAQHTAAHQRGSHPCTGRPVIFAVFLWVTA